jgi:enoyl-CoA hydratase/carnithine racemase
VTSEFLDSLDLEAENMVRAARTSDHKEAVRAFIDKRRPAFAGH